MVMAEAASDDRTEGLPEGLLQPGINTTAGNRWLRERARRLLRQERRERDEDDAG